VLPDRARLPTPEELLVDYARRLSRHRAGRRVLWFHLSRLAQENRRESDLQLIANRLRPLVNETHGELFSLASGDIVVCLKDPDAGQIDAAMDQARLSFAHDALMQRAELEGTHVFVTGYDMAERYDAFLAHATRALAGEGEGAPVGVSPGPPSGLGDRLVLSREEIRRLGADATMVSGHINTSQGRIAVERLLERRAIAALEGGPRPRRWGVREVVRPEAIDAFDSLAMALARHQITESIALSEVERALLPGLPEHFKASAERHHVVALHAEALMSPEFLLFDRQMDSAKIAKPLVAFWSEELRDHRDTIVYLRSFLGERRYRLGAAGLAIGDLAEMSVHLKELQFVEVDHPGEITARDAELLKRLVMHLGAEGVLLCELRSQKALVIARRAGIRLVAGPVVDAAL